MTNGVYSEAEGGYLLTYRSVQGGEQGMFLSLRGPEPAWCPIGFDRPSGWQIQRLGISSIQTLQFSSAVAANRVLLADFGPDKANVLEWTPLATTDNGSRISCQYFTLLGNPDPTKRQIVREVRLDYRADSASSMSLRMTPDFGATYPVSVNVALPPAPLSAQTVIHVGLSAVYPGFELRHDSSQTFTIQGLSAIVEEGGNA
jgi:hypothetical protein